MLKSLAIIFLLLEKNRIIGWSHVKIDKGMKQKGYLLNTIGVKNKEGKWTTKKF